MSMVLSTAAGPTAVTADELVSLVDSIDPAYSDNGAWAMRPATYWTILKLKGSTGGSFLFEAEGDANGRPLLLGFPVYFCPSLPAMAATQKAIVFGDLSKLVRRVVTNSLTVVVLVERYAEYSEIGYEVRVRTDFQL